jgi:hypothetical protein
MTWSTFMGEWNFHFEEMRSISLLGMELLFFSISFVHRNI